MRHDADEILSILDTCCDEYTFPMLDNGYVYLAATRLGLFRSPADWGLVIEVFGYSPRSGVPDTHVYTFASRLHDRNKPDSYVSREAYETYLSRNPNNESRFIHPVDEGEWCAEEQVSPSARELVLRDRSWPIPPLDAYAREGIELEEPGRPGVHELARLLSARERDAVLATAAERRASIPPELTEILLLDEWNHPDVVDDDARPSGSETFRQLAEVLVTGDLGRYRPTLPPNTHWRNWPGGGTL